MHGANLSCVEWKEHVDYFLDRFKIKYTPTTDRYLLKVPRAVDEEITIQLDGSYKDLKTQVLEDVSSGTAATETSCHVDVTEGDGKTLLLKINANSMEDAKWIAGRLDLKCRRDYTQTELHDSFIEKWYKIFGISEQDKARLQQKKQAAAAAAAVETTTGANCNKDIEMEDAA